MAPQAWGAVDRAFGEWAGGQLAESCGEPDAAIGAKCPVEWCPGREVGEHTEIA